VRLMLHAPGVHTGGGRVLLEALLATPAAASAWLQLDRRLQHGVTLAASADVRYVARSFASRLAAEWRLWRASREDRLVLCFHGLPPWFPVRGRVVVFLQNRILVECGGLAHYPFRVAARLRLERLVLRLFRRRVDEFLVQTPSMARALARRYAGGAQVRVLPFPGRQPERPCTAAGTDYDFVYVASGLAHKNHRRLLDAWSMLASDGLFPSLALTVEADNGGILRRLDALRSAHPVRVDNLPDLERECIFSLYRSSRALIFPSLGESLGLPLLEATACGLPILAAERDYVRDLVQPVQTFDPESAVSIARAVRRFLEQPEPALPVFTADQFLAQVLRQ
jgi:glycosyltransferase involved in cell wall biosynthesis